MIELKLTQTNDSHHPENQGESTKIISGSYDIVIAGAGCAGLSLAYRLNHSHLRDKKILLIDKDGKTQNDRTWCFWTNQPMLFDRIVYRQWDQIWFHSPRVSKLIDLHPYSYKMIRGIDFYEFIGKDLAQNPHIHRVNAKILSIEQDSKAARVYTTNGIAEAGLVFNSLPKIRPQKAGYHYFKQHFLGWTINCEEKRFIPGEATLMDFRIEQEGETRFVYVLPFNDQTAMIEFTVFSEQLLEMQVYEDELKKYIRDHLGIASFQIEHREFGVIPMYDEPFDKKEGSFVINTGTAGGKTRSSTGYTFIYIQQQCDRILKELLKGKKPDFREKDKKRFKLYDGMLLNVMKKKRMPSRDIFEIMFGRHSIQKIFRFLDEQSSLAEDLSIMASMPPLPFLKALCEEIFKKR